MSNTNNKGFTIVITDNETGETLVNYTEARAIICGISVEGMSHSIGFVHGNLLDIAHAISEAQRAISDQIEEHPEVEVAAKLIGVFIEDKEGGDDDDE